MPHEKRKIKPNINRVCIEKPVNIWLSVKVNEKNLCTLITKKKNKGYP